MASRTRLTESDLGSAVAESRLAVDRELVTTFEASSEPMSDAMLEAASDACICQHAQQSDCKALSPAMSRAAEYPLGQQDQCTHPAHEV